MEIWFKQNYERTAKSVHTNLLLRNVWKLGSNKIMRERRRSFIKTAFGKSVENRFKQGYERTAKSVHTNLLSRKMWKLGLNKVMRERCSPFIQTGF